MVPISTLPRPDLPGRSRRCPVRAHQGQRIVKEGKTLETTEDNLAELADQAQAFAEKQLPVLRALGIV
ncbi:MAG: hypothetical protein Q8M92_06080 [Candidatus Subteraquimicrobiales bacterium]|nr:hypothetical protein [Candidatus Subteraquimicrobiales bacterium]